MSMVVLQLPAVKRKNATRPQQCPSCQGQTFQRWGKGCKRVRDNRYRSVEVFRYRCCRCHRTFRHYPPGVDRADQTQRLRKLAALLWVLGLSLRGVCAVLSAFGVRLSHMSVWRDIQEQAHLLEGGRQRRSVGVLGVDGVYLRLKGHKCAVLIAVDLGDGKPVAVAQIEEVHPQAVVQFLSPLVEGLGVSVMVTDDLASLRVAAEGLGVGHQVCQFHVRRWVGRTLRHLRQTLTEQWQWVLDEIQRCLAELPADGGRRLFELWMQVGACRVGQGQAQSAVDQLRALLLRLSEHWSSYRLFAREAGIPWTNNGTEQVIGRIRVRSRTVRGYKSWEGMWAGLMLSGCGVDW